MARWVLFVCVAATAYGQTFEVQPKNIPQGNTIRVRGAGGATGARLDGRTVPLFQQKDGGWLGLMPVPATEKPGTYTLDVLGANGAVVQSIPIVILNARFPKQNIVLSKALTELKASPDESETVGAFRKEVVDTRYWTEPLEAPVPGCMTSPYGVQRLHNGKPTGDFHAGLDMRAREGQPIRATTGGVVKIARQFSLHGGTVAIDHGQGLQSMYLHMSKIAATEGATVQKGDVIGYAGSTGRSTAPHLHWSIYVNGVPVNPRQWVQVGACAQAAKPAHTKKQK